MKKRFGLIGTITHDVITYESGKSFEGVGGVLYQAAVLCGLGTEVILFTNLGEKLVPDVERIIRNWHTLRGEKIIRVPGPGNRVHLHYPEKGERIEILKSVVPPLNPSHIFEDLSELEMLVCVINSGFDIELRDWQEIVHSAMCPVWLDVHSLCLSRVLNQKREYFPLKEWREWIEGVSFVQANKKEVTSMLGSPEREPSEAEISQFGKEAFKLGVKAICVTLGEEGVLVITPERSIKIASFEAEREVDTTGCGDVLCGGAVVKLAEGNDFYPAVSFGVELASKEVSIAGIEKTYALVSRLK